MPRDFTALRWRLALIACVACAVLACSRQAAPTTGEASRPAVVASNPQPARAAERPPGLAATPPPTVHSGAAGADHGSWATTGTSIPQALRQPCDNVKGLIRSVVMAVPASTKISESVGPRAITFQYQFASATAAGCEFVTRGSDTDSSSNTFEAMEKAFERAKWAPMEAGYSADGPDGSDLGYSRDGLLCVVEGRWDGGDDSDPTIIPGPEFDVFVTCAPTRADDQPAP